ncbi:MAG: hypothetical protein IJ572_04600 [Bacilli bacterium]|nr:hypothetical protein [Bacilli bacterium]
MNNQYLIPANSKKSKLIFSIFTGFDLALFAIGISTTLILMAIIRTSNIMVMAFLIMPAIVTGLLVMPIPNYHNVLGFFKSMYYYFSNRRNYRWRGWCVKDVYGRDYENRKG